MPNSKNAAKRARTSEKSHQRNAETKSALKTLRKSLLDFPRQALHAPAADDRRAWMRPL